MQGKLGCVPDVALSSGCPRKDRQKRRESSARTSIKAKTPGSMRSLQNLPQVPGVFSSLSKPITTRTPRRKLVKPNPNQLTVCRLQQMQNTMSLVKLGLMARNTEALAHLVRPGACKPGNQSLKVSLLMLKPSLSQKPRPNPEVR